MSDSKKNQDLIDLYSGQSTTSIAAAAASNIVSVRERNAQAMEKARDDFRRDALDRKYGSKTSSTASTGPTIGSKSSDNSDKQTAQSKSVADEVKSSTLSVPSSAGSLPVRLKSPPEEKEDSSMVSRELTLGLKAK